MATPTERPDLYTEPQPCCPEGHYLPLVRDRERSGLPYHVEDEALLDKVAGWLWETWEAMAERGEGPLAPPAAGGATHGQG
jgi:hypothetical protein